MSRRRLQSSPRTGVRRANQTQLRPSPLFRYGDDGRAPSVAQGWEVNHATCNSFVEHNRTKKRVLVDPSQVIIVDGILILENCELRDLMDIKIFVDSDADVRLARRILRDVCDRGRTMESVITQYLSTVKPMHEAFVEPSKRHADVIVPQGGGA